MGDIQPACYGIRRKGQVAYIGMVPAKVATTRPTSEEYRENYEERELYDQSVIDDLLAQVVSAKGEAFAALALLSRMRFACGDNGTRMQDELEKYLAGLRRDAERLSWLDSQMETGVAPSIVNDDDGRWAYCDSGFSPMPQEGGHKETVSVTAFADPEMWRGSIREAIDAAMAAERGEG